MEFSYNSNNYLLYSLVGYSRYKCESRRPGLKSAGSIKSGLELAATMKTPSMEATPSR